MSLRKERGLRVNQVQVAQALRVQVAQIALLRVRIAQALRVQAVAQIAPLRVQVVPALRVQVVRAQGHHLSPQNQIRK